MWKSNFLEIKWPNLFVLFFTSINSGIAYRKVKFCLFSRKQSYFPFSYLLNSLKNRETFFEAWGFQNTPEKRIFFKFQIKIFFQFPNVKHQNSDFKVFWVIDIGTKEVNAQTWKQFPCFIFYKKIIGPILYWKLNWQ